MLRAVLFHPKNTGQGAFVTWTYSTVYNTIKVGATRGTPGRFARYGIFFLKNLTQAQAWQPQLVLLDLMMPRPSGLEVIPRLRALLPHVRIIALTLLDTSSYRRAALAAGADAFVAKSSMETDLLPAVQQVMQTRGGAGEPADESEPAAG